MDVTEYYLKEIIIPLLFFWSLFLVICFCFECMLLPFLKKKTKMKIKIFHPNYCYKFIFFLCLILQIYATMCKRELYTSQEYYAVLLAFVYTALRQKYYSKGQINLNLEDNGSIGALWADQTYKAYYEKTFRGTYTAEDILQRMRNFEDKYNIQFYIKKLVIVIPLSCDIEGLYTEKDPLIESFGHLEIVEDDAGGNINREFKNPVYKICSDEDIYIVTEYSRPVSALWKSRFIIEKEKLRYIRDCYVKTLKLHLQGNPCILVLYDDENGSQSLSKCILSAIDEDQGRIKEDRRGAHFLV